MFFKLQSQLGPQILARQTRLVERVYVSRLAEISKAIHQRPSSCIRNCFRSLTHCARAALRTQAKTDSEAKPAWTRGAETADEFLSDCLKTISSADRNTAEQLAEQALEKFSSRCANVCVTFLICD